MQHFAGGSAVAEHLAVLQSLELRWAASGSEPDLALVPEPPLGGSTEWSALSLWVRVDPPFGSGMFSLAVAVDGPEALLVGASGVVIEPGQVATLRVLAA